MTSVFPRAILSDLFRGGGGNSEAMIFGQMLHSVFQNVIVEATKGSKVTRGMVQAEMKKIVCTLEHLEQLYVCVIVCSFICLYL